MIELNSSAAHNKYSTVRTVGPTWYVPVASRIRPVVIAGHFRSLCGFPRIYLAGRELVGQIP
jgi:hypothetical protein